MHEILTQIDKSDLISEDAKTDSSSTRPGPVMHVQRASKKWFLSVLRSKAAVELRVSLVCRQASL